MALSQSALSELLDAIRAGGSVDVMREAMTLVLQELIELEAAQAIGAGRYERTDERTTHRNGSREPAALHQGRRRRAAHPEAPDGLVLPGAARAARGSTGPSGRSSWRPTSTA